jgi:hypothetical protein
LFGGKIMTLCGKSDHSANSLLVLPLYLLKRKEKVDRNFEKENFIKNFSNKNKSMAKRVEKGEKKMKKTLSDTTC